MIKNLIYVYFTFRLSSKVQELNVTLAQLVERLTFNQVVGGSSPSCDKDLSVSKWYSCIMSQLVEQCGVRPVWSWIRVPHATIVIYPRILTGILNKIF